MLVGQWAGVDNILHAFATFVAGRVIIQMIPFHEDRHHRTAAGRGVTTVNADATVAKNKLSCFLGIDLNIGFSIDHNRLNLFASDTATSV